MGSIGRYIFRTTLGAFLIVCTSVTALMWITQAMRDIDLMTNQGQSIFVFIGLTGLIIPLLVQIIAPIALMIAVSHVLNKLGNDSELIVMNAAGMPPWILFRPFLAAGIVVSLLVAAISIYVSPWGLRELRRWSKNDAEAYEEYGQLMVEMARFIKPILGIVPGDPTEMDPRPLMPIASPSGLMCTRKSRPKRRAVSSRNAIISRNFHVVSMCMNGNGGFAGANAFIARCSITELSLPIE